MLIRNATPTDIKAVAVMSISRGNKEFPESVDHVYAAEHDGAVLGVGGIKLMTPTVAWCWMDWSEGIRGHMIPIYRMVWDWLDTLVKLHGLKRLMAAVECDFPEAIRTVEHLGFHQESIMLNWNGDKSAYLYVRLEN